MVNVIRTRLCACKVRLSSPLVVVARVLFTIPTALGRSAVFSSRKLLATTVSVTTEVTVLGRSSVNSWKSTFSVRLRFTT